MVLVFGFGFGFVKGEKEEKGEKRKGTRNGHSRVKNKRKHNNFVVVFLVV